MKLSRLIPVASLALTAHSLAADPAWWAARGVKSANPASNLSPATIGQAKHMAAMALAEIENRIPAQSFAALEDEVATIVNLEVPQFPPGYNPAPPPPGYVGPNHRILLVGQLKALSKPFYDNIRLWYANWLDAEMIAADLLVVEPGSNPSAYSPYPWTVATSDDENMAIATLGQLKAVFSIDFSRLAPVLLSDRDADGTPDELDTFPDDPTRHLPPPSEPMDTIAPVMVLTAPDGATEL